ncbi:hypothetical protein VFPFJ_07683 [Purpureocillium lilacinum]|uniref:Uncharacterized protein n=1 Tax=Purpureocillium lilacinum TaxID=33203 RepID=A0A179GIM0_PURLI|nr:hypothetical protein VFPFJ_07683 [Purpureocillium lilacinum]OAQ77705.1 hypothetical protein VFPBJ_08177 [Purpureocillium lilacinum]OAQ85294.1 hypothetical protein VFPFJ_07683 [Purpureocillium lilacinum]
MVPIKVPIMNGLMAAASHEAPAVFQNGKLTTSQSCGPGTRLAHCDESAEAVGSRPRSISASTRMTDGGRRKTEHTAHPNSSLGHRVRAEQPQCRWRQTLGGMVAVRRCRSIYCVRGADDGAQLWWPPPPWPGRTSRETTTVSSGSEMDLDPLLGSAARVGPPTVANRYY